MMAGKRDDRHGGRFGAWTGRRVLASFIGFFGIVFAVNGYFIYAALSTFDGVEVEGAYQKGRAYNHLLEQMDEQRRLGWTAAIATDPAPAGGTRLTVAFAGAGGAPLSGLEVEGLFWRPVAAGEDQRLPLAETSAGTYETVFNLAHDGNWLVRIAAQGPAGETFVQEQRAIITRETN
ncbi:MAG: FixH family protein [Parvibaculum sp.]|uniref:FixH family protein n=1 Tax=Parvibaculum sp. TaxID=2024848 RepID=UPI0027218078|nr:FixH family protein [Parvibaculum sp.]MDO8837816.1 FixH family protein [Parvibaculum sp.]